MTGPAQIALIGEYDPSLTAHQAIPLALELAREATGTRFDAHWLSTGTIRDMPMLAGYDAFWCIPGTPYRSLDGALTAIRYARESGRPLLATCGGFAYAVIEFARHVLGWADAGSTGPAAGHTVLCETGYAPASAETLRLVPGTRIAGAYGTDRATEAPHCRYRLDPRFREALMAGPLRPSATDAAGDVRGVELQAHPFFVAVLFQPEEAAHPGRTPPLVAAFLRACAPA